MSWNFGNEPSSILRKLTPTEVSNNESDLIPRAKIPFLFHNMKWQDKEFPLTSQSLKTAWYFNTAEVVWTLLLDWEITNHKVYTHFLLLSLKSSRRCPQGRGGTVKCKLLAGKSCFCSFLNFVFLPPESNHSRCCGIEMKSMRAICSLPLEKTFLLRDTSQWFLTFCVMDSSSKPVKPMLPFSESCL